ncbi:MAG: NAD(P)H-hydrate epimerase [wastewater metagenome]|nr:NAD(P)H-hydrate epimerase [Candidatus Loosdrechtia aerotolerans]
MEKILTREEMRELDRRAIEEYKIPGIILMENAGRNVTEEVMEMIQDKPGTMKVAVLCGKGNNGGDGFVIARHLHNRSIPVDVFLFANISDVVDGGGDAGINLRILLNMKIPVKDFPEMTDINDTIVELNSYDILIDALFGTGLSGEVREPFHALIHGINSLNKPVVSVDIPSGLDCNTGRVLGVAIKATRTVTFAASKRGFYMEDGPIHTGKITVTDISIPGELI